MYDMCVVIDPETGARVGACVCRGSPFECHSRVTLSTWLDPNRLEAQDIEQVFFRIHNRATSTIDVYVPPVVRSLSMTRGAARACGWV